MLEFLALNCLPEGQSAYVTEIHTEPSMHRRLADLGLIPGTQVTCLYRSPAGDPTAYLIRSAVIALRNHDAAQIRVEPIHTSVTAVTVEAPA